MPFESPQETVFFRAHDSPLEKNDFSQLASNMLYYNKAPQLSTIEKGRHPEKEGDKSVFAAISGFLGSLFFEGMRTQKR
jgi:hypothetical protein